MHRSKQLLNMCLILINELTVPSFLFQLISNEAYPSLLFLKFYQLNFYLPSQNLFLCTHWCSCIFYIENNLEDICLTFTFFLIHYEN